MPKRSAEESVLSELGSIFTLKEEQGASLKAFSDVKDDFSFSKSLVKHRSGGAPLIMLPAGSTLDVVGRSFLQSPSCFFMSFIFLPNVFYGVFLMYSYMK